MGRSRNRPNQEPPKDTRSAAAKEADEELETQLYHLKKLAQDAGAEGGTAKIFRRDPTTRKEKFLESVPTNQIWDSVHEYLSDNHGGGTYKLVLVDENSRFVPGAGRLIFDVEGPPKVRTPESEDTRKLDDLEKRVADMMGKNGGADVSSADMVRLLMEISREQLREARNPPAGAMSANPMEMAVSLVAALQAGQTPLLQALIERASQPAPDMLAQMKGLAEMMVTLRELSGGGESSGWARVVDRVADPLANLLDQHVLNQKAGVAPPATMGGAPVQTNNQPPHPAAGSPPWLRMMGPYLPRLLNYARAGRDPVTVADFVAEELPDQSLGVVYATLTDSNFPEEFVRYVPDAAPVREWFGDFFARVLEWIDPPAGSEPPPAPQRAAEPPATSKPEVGTVADGDPGE